MKQPVSNNKTQEKEGYMIRQCTYITVNPETAYYESITC